MGINVIINVLACFLLHIFSVILKFYFKFQAVVTLFFLNRTHHPKNISGIKFQEIST
jgi:hypothetical protein